MFLYWRSFCICVLVRQKAIVELLVLLELLPVFIHFPPPQEGNTPFLSCCIAELAELIFLPVTSRWIINVAFQTFTLLQKKNAWYTYCCANMVLTPALVPINEACKPVHSYIKHFWGNYRPSETGMGQLAVVATWSQPSWPWESGHSWTGHRKLAAIYYFTWWPPLLVKYFIRIKW